MKQWLASLNSRERQLVLGGAAVLFVMAAYLLVWEPMQKKAVQLEKSVAAQRSVYAWMQQAAQQVKGLRGSTPTKKLKGGSLLGTINTTAKKVLAGAVLKRVEEDRQQGVRVWIEQVAFDDLIRWLGQLQQQYGISVASLVTERHQQVGKVNVRLILQGGSAKPA